MGRYYQLVVAKAQRRVRGSPVVGASDVAISVWDTILRGLPEGRFPCTDREEFEDLLGKITYHKAINLYHWAKTPQRHPAEKLSDEQILQEHPLDEAHRQVAERFYLQGQAEQEIAAALGIGLEEVQQRIKHIRRWLQQHRYRPVGHLPADALEKLSAGDQPLDVLVFEELIAGLEDNLRQTVLLKLQGLSNREIADQLDVSERQIQRRLQLLKNMLESQLAPE
jgi:DNA-directed RNA polymerase specialized sigma24 family protein